LTIEGAYDRYRFIITTLPSSMADEKPTFTYNCFSSELELKKLPIINWPGVKFTAYRQTTKLYESLQQYAEDENQPLILISPPKLMDGTTGYEPIELFKTPKVGTITVTRVHRDYGVEIPLFLTLSQDGSSINEDEYYLYESGGSLYIKAYVPGNIKLPVDNAGSIR
jgi:hypothetical protein